MHGRSFVLPFATAILAVPVLAGEPTRRAAVLPEVLKHMDQALTCIHNNNMGEARAHAELVLVGSSVTYTVAFQGVKQGQQDRCVRALESAMDEWEKDLDGTVHFRRVTDAAEANVQVRFRPSVQMKGEEVAGYVNWKRSISNDRSHPVTWSYKADMQVRTLNTDDSTMPYDAIRHASMHELGHVLGLDDSEQQGDVMGPLDVSRPAMCPKNYEIAAVRDLRERALQLKNDAMADVGR